MHLIFVNIIFFILLSAFVVNRKTNRTIMRARRVRYTTYYRIYRIIITIIDNDNNNKLSYYDVLSWSLTFCFFLPFLSSMSGNTVQLAVFGLSLPVGCSGANGLSPGAGGYLRKKKIKMRKNGQHFNIILSYYNERAVIII